MAKDLIRNKKVAFYTGCFANYYYPEVGKATVKILRKGGIEVVVPEQVCCGLPMMAKGNARGAYKNMRYNSRVFSQLVQRGYVIITTCSSCGLMIRRNYPLLLGSEEARLVSENTFHITEYLLELIKEGELKVEFQYKAQTVFYHTPCHLRAQGIGQVSLQMLQMLPGLMIKKVSNECCGMGGSYGYEKANYEISKEIGSKLFSEVKENPTDRVVTDCGGCKLQIESGTGVKVEHPIILIAEAI